MRLFESLKSLPGIRTGSPRSLRFIGCASPAGPSLPLVRAFLLTLACACFGSLSLHASTLFPGVTTVGQQSASLTVTVNIATSGVATAVQALTQGIAGQDFTVTGGGTCSVNAAYLAGQQCTVNAIFAPRHPGLRFGAIELQGAGGVLLGTAPIAGVAIGPLSVLNPGEIDTLAGNGQLIYLQDNVPATQAPIFLPYGVTTDPNGNIYLSDTGNNRVRRVDAQTGLISTVAGNGTAGYSGDGGPATQANINQPSGLTLDGSGNLYFADSGNNIIRRVDAVTGIITTVAGTPATQGYSGDGGAATAATLFSPHGLAFDAAGDLFIADTSNNVVREVSATTGTIATVAGTGVAGYNSDGILATAALLNSPWSVTVDAANSLYIADQANDRVREVTAGMISTVAGSSTRGFDGDGGPATAAQLDHPASVAVDPAGDMYIADTNNSRVRKVYKSTGLIDTIAGNFNETFQGDGGPSNKAYLYAPYSLFVDQSGNVYIADTLNNRIRRILSTAVPLSFSPTSVGQTSAPQVVAIENDGNGSLSPAAPTLNNAALDRATTTCAAGAAVPASATCNLGVEFAPAAIGNPVAGSVTVNSNAANSPVVISVGGQGVNLVATATSLVSSLNPSLVGQPVTLTATVTSTDTSLSGAVTFLDGTTILCGNAPLNAGVAICSTTFTLGQHNLTASYAGDSNSLPSVSPVLVQIAKQQPNLGLVASPNPVTFAASVTLTLTAGAATGTPTGSAVFYDGANALSGSIALNASGVAAFAATRLAPGQHNLSAQYSGDAANLSGTSNTVVEVVNQAATTTTLTSSNSTVTVGTPVTFTATIVNTNAPTPTGTVQFTQGGITLGTAPVSAVGQATLTISTLAAGTDSIVATYGGDAGNLGSSSSPIAEVVQLFPTQIALTASANPATYGSPLTLTATVLGNGGVPTGTVTFSNGGTVLGSATLNASGVGLFTTSSLAPGLYSIVANYASDGKADASTSAPLALDVRQSTTIALASSANPAPTLSSIVLTATLTGNGTAPITGNVTFNDGTTLLGTASIDGTGHATLNVPSLAAGSHMLLASYSGDTDDSSSVSSTLLETIQLRPTTTALTYAPTNPTNPQQLTLTGVVGFTAAIAPPTGTITFTDAGAVIGSGSIDSSGVATMNLTLPMNTSDTVIASYSGDASYAPSASVPTVVDAGPTQFTMALNPPSVTIQTTQHTSINVTIQSYDGFTDTLQFGCLGLPFAATCTFSNAQPVLAANGTATVQLIVDTGDPLGAGAEAHLTQSSSPNPLLCALPFGVLTGLLLFYRRRRAPIGILLLLCLGAAIGSIAGCAGLQMNGTPAGSYTFKVTASGQNTGATVSQSVSLTVTQ